MAVAKSLYCSCWFHLGPEIVRAVGLCSHCLCFTLSKNQLHHLLTGGLAVYGLVSRSWTTCVVGPLCGWLSGGWDVRGLLFTLMMTHCGMASLILSSALWIKNRLWLTLCTLWPFESWQWRKRHVCHIEKCLSTVRGKSKESTFESLSTPPRIQCLLWSQLHSAVIHPLSCAACLISKALDQHPRLFSLSEYRLG